MVGSRRLAELAARSPALAIAGAEINRETVLAQVNEISELRGVIAHIGNVTRQATRTADEKVALIAEIIAEYHKGKK